MSSTKRTKHIHNRYFLIKDLVDRGEVEVKYEGTETMWSDVLTKPKQDTPFKKLRAELMNIDVQYDNKAERSRTHPDLLPKEDYDEIHGTIVKRVLSTTDDKKWNTIPRTYKEIDDLRAKFEKSKETKKLKMLEEINAYVEELEKVYSRA